MQASPVWNLGNIFTEPVVHHVMWSLMLCDTERIEIRSIVPMFMVTKIPAYCTARVYWPNIKLHSGLVLAHKAYKSPSMLTLLHKLLVCCRFLLKCKYCIMLQCWNDDKMHSKYMLLHVLIIVYTLLHTESQIFKAFPSKPMWRC